MIIFIISYFKFIIAVEKVVNLILINSI